MGSAKNFHAAVADPDPITDEKSFHDQPFQVQNQKPRNAGRLAIIETKRSPVAAEKIQSISYGNTCNFSVR